MTKLCAPCQALKMHLERHIDPRLIETPTSDELRVRGTIFRCRQGEENRTSWEFTFPAQNGKKLRVEHHWGDPRNGNLPFEKTLAALLRFLEWHLPRIT